MDLGMFDWAAIPLEAQVISVTITRLINCCCVGAGHIGSSVSMNSNPQNHKQPPQSFHHKYTYNASTPWDWKMSEPPQPTLLSKHLPEAVRV